jgi:L-alanine-DL-glutamate epimerase-like enolase superfamily enzyme
MEPPAAMHAAISRFKASGFRAFKIGWGPFGRRNDPGLDEAIVAAARDAAGPAAQLMVDAGGSDAYWPNGLKWALRTADMLARHDVYWFEEPLIPDALEDYRQLRRSSPVAIAGGEVLTRRQSFRPWLVGGAFDIVQPDVTKVGGISEQRRIAWMANEFGVRYIGHGWNTALGLAADLQLASVFADTIFVEYIGGSPYVDGITRGGFAIDPEGFLAIPATPGLGIELDPAALAKYTPDPAPLFAP